MLGETALPAENDSIPYQYQCEYFDHVFRYAKDCGVCGFGWWEFQDANIGVFEGKYAGILHHNDTTYTADGKHRILGAPKPIAEHIQTALEYIPQNQASRPFNYYNMLGYSNICIKGKVVNKRNKGIEGAVVRGWNKDWSVGMHTFTDSEGNFTLYSNDSCVHFKISGQNQRLIKIVRIVLSIVLSIILAAFVTQFIPSVYIGRVQVEIFILFVLFLGLLLYFNSKYTGMFHITIAIFALIIVVLIVGKIGWKSHAVINNAINNTSINFQAAEVEIPLPKNHDENVKIIEEEVAYNGVSVIIPHRTCLVELKKHLGEKK